MKLLPTRFQHKTVELVADLDSLVEESVSFKLQGKTHEIKPIELEEFMKFSNAYARIYNFSSSKEELPPEKLKRMYVELFSSICPTVNMSVVERMSQAQIGALYQLMVDTVLGKANIDQKKTLQRAMEAASLANRS